MTATLYGIPNCDTVKKARKWLEAQGIAYVFHDLRQDGVEAVRLDHWTRALGWERLLNRRSTTWRQLPETAKLDLDDTKAQVLMLAQPTLIKRPVLEHGETVLAGFSEPAYRTEFGVDAPV